MDNLPGLVSRWLAKTFNFLASLWARIARPHPSLQDLGRQRRAQLMMGFALTIALGMLAPILMGKNHDVNRLVILVGLVGLALLAFALGHTRLYKWGSVLLVFGLAAVGFALVLTGRANNPSDALSSTLPLVLVLGSALFALRGQLLLTFVCGIGPLILPLVSARVSYADGMLLDAGVFFVLGLLLVAVTIFRDSLERTRVAELRAANQALHAMQSTLEARVTERTRAAETARAEAEHARQAAETAQSNLETQVWLATGQTLLAERMRGEQNVARLGENIIAHLSSYTGAQAGALFLLDGHTLRLSAGYAFAGRPGFSGDFQLGEGLVGQAALDRRVLRLDRIPADALVISSGLINLAPRELLVAPFHADGEVLGVIELASLSGFTHNHLDLLARSVEGIGVAFRSAQAREKLASLLMETQQQAEELQVQEEELRAANEELNAQAEIFQAQRGRKAAWRSGSAQEQA